MTRPVVDTVGAATPNELLNANSYQKGSWVLHMLRRQLGDSVFHQSIRQYYAMYAGKNADTKDLQKVFEIVSGKKSDIFFEQWLHRPVNPQLSIKWKYLVKEKKIRIVTEQLQSGQPFQLPLEISIATGHSKPVIQKINISKKTETFTFPAGQKPVLIKADPFTSLLIEATVTEIK